jgi:glucokinase
MGNDANLAALGEYRYGTGLNSAACLVMLTIGTGIGGGVIMRPVAVDGQATGPLILLGGNKGGAELGHVVIAHGGLDCSAGTYGAIEGYCQAASIIRRAQHKHQRYPSSILARLSSNNPELIDGEMLTRAAKEGCEVSKQTYAEVGEYLGIGIGNFINIFAPQIVAIGGNFANAGELLLEPARASAKRVAIPALYRFATIAQAKQIENAGILGAAALAYEQAGSK